MHSNILLALQNLEATLPSAQVFPWKRHLSPLFLMLLPSVLSEPSSPRVLLPFVFPQYFRSSCPLESPHSGEPGLLGEPPWVRQFLSHPNFRNSFFPGPPLRSTSTVPPAGASVGTARLLPAAQPDRIPVWQAARPRCWTSVIWCWGGPAFCSGVSFCN